MAAIDSLADEKYVLLTTFRKDGRAVPTPVWAVRDGDALAVWTGTDSGKVKRIRRQPDVTVAPCDRRGTSNGDAVTGRAVVTDQAGTDRVRASVAKKYGVMGRLIMFGSRLRLGRDGTVGILITFP